jgi:nicotinamidase-related amidase
MPQPVLVVIDVQERLFDAMDAERRDDMVRNTKILGIAARRLGVPVMLSEQDPKGLGRTLPSYGAFSTASRLSNEPPSPAAACPASSIDFASSRPIRSSSWASRRMRVCCSPRSIASALVSGSA